ncbi:PaaI family thioesterase [Zoogloea sp.]|uniref:PaaI family thioesterase n=1 Tax=Zoogloea sp. TaxID=49181 RepID=UPI0035AEC3BC
MNASSPREAIWLEQGYRPWPAAGGFLPANARLFHREDGAHLRFRVELGPAHCNGSGRVHGGFIATLADVWLGYNLARRLAPEVRFVTASLQVDYLGAVAAGDWLESEIDWVRTGGKLNHAAGRIRSGDGRLVTAMRASFVSLGA